MSHDVQDDVYSTFAVSVRLLMEELNSTLDEWYTNVRTNSAAKAQLDAQETTTKPTQPETQTPIAPAALPQTERVSTLRIKAAKAMAQANSDRATAAAYLESAAKNYAEAYSYAESDTAASNVSAKIDLTSFTDGQLRLTAEQYAKLSGITVTNLQMVNIERKAMIAQARSGTEARLVDTGSSNVVEYAYPVEMLTKIFKDLGYIE